MKRFVATVFLLIPSLAAAEFSYKYAELAVDSGSLEFGGQNFDVNSHRGEISLAYHEKIALLLRASTSEVQMNAGDDLERSNIGATVLFHTPLNETLDIVLGVGRSRLDLDSRVGGVSRDVDGNSTDVLAAIRVAVNEEFEVEVRVIGQEVFGDREETGIVSGRLAFGKHLGGVLSYSRLKDDDMIGFGLRVSF